MDNKYKILKPLKTKSDEIKSWEQVVDFTEIKKGGISIDKILNCL